ncbi:MAG: inorganic diphosphatase [Acidobacteria bacterium]|nr:inorganic diphosphatase [Acidobacteriota bacterium]
MTVRESKRRASHGAWIWIGALVCLAGEVQPAAPPVGLPEAAAAALQRSIEAARPHETHVWRDTPPLNTDGTVNAYIEITRGERRKFELNIATNSRVVDRVMPRELGGYPINYGLVPQTVSYDGDPFDVLVLGPAIRGGTVVRGVIVGVMHMDDEKGLDSKVIVSRVDGRGRPHHVLGDGDRRRLTAFFDA